MKDTTLCSSIVSGGSSVVLCRVVRVTVFVDVVFFFNDTATTEIYTG